MAAIVLYWLKPAAYAMEVHILHPHLTPTRLSGRP